MSSFRQKQPYLVPEQGVELVDGQTVATSLPVWLRIEPGLARRKWVRLRYSASFFDEPVRPLIRFVLASGETITLPMNGPVLGSAEWIGRIPDGTVSALISPTRRTGPFAFHLEAITSLSRAALLRRALQRPDWLYWAIRSRLLNSRQEAWQALSFAVGGTPMDAYAEWHARLARPLDLRGLDRPRSEWRCGPRFHVLLDLRRSDDADQLKDQLKKTIESLESLRAQAYQHWHLYAVMDETTEPSSIATFRAQVQTDVRFSELAQQFPPVGADAKTISENDFLTVLNAGDRLPVYALSVVAEEVAREPNLDLVYGDEDGVTPDGELHSPVLKPDWSPVLQEGTRYLGRTAFLRVRRPTAGYFRRLAAGYETAIDEASRDISRHRIRRIPRVLCTHQAQTHRATVARATALVGVPAHRQSVDPKDWPEVAVVIPTRDHAKLLADCVAGLRGKTDYPRLEIVVVDNGSTQPEAKRLLDQIASEQHTQVLRRPGSFNFSALSNDGAHATTAPVLLFLNNDVRMLEPGWLKTMVRWAIQPEIGVVGAKLLFANGPIQHAGVVLGFGGIAGHIYRRMPNDHPGYLSQLKVPREVTAATAACIAVERSKFEAVGGFDAENLPVDLNDIDFCLRVAERGWINLWSPDAALIHLQSATRGIDSDPFVLYRKERNYFVRRWAEATRDDRYFHPALSLYAHHVALA